MKLGFLLLVSISSSGHRHGRLLQTQSLGLARLWVLPVSPTRFVPPLDAQKGECQNRGDMVPRIRRTNGVNFELRRNATPRRIQAVPSPVWESPTQ